MGPRPCSKQSTKNGDVVHGGPQDLMSHGQNSFKGRYVGIIRDPRLRATRLHIRSFDHGHKNKDGTCWFQGPV